MKQAFILLISVAVVFVAPGAQGTAHLSFSDTPANVTRARCGTDLMCVETPEDCDPATNNTCLFASVNCTAGVAPNGATASFQLSGTTNGDSYIALVLTANASEGTSMVFICARTNTSMNPTFFFRTMQRNNTSGMLTPTETIVTGIQRSITNARIQCAFDVPGLNATAMSNAVTFTIRLGSGSVNGTDVGAINLTTTALNFTCPASNLNNTPTPTTPTPSNNATSNITTPTPSNNATSNITTPTPSNNATSNITTPIPSNNATSNITTPTPSNNATSNITTPIPSNNTTPIPSNNTTPTPTIPALVTRTGCERTKLCVEIPDDCDPATNSSCLFASVNVSTPLRLNGITLIFELSGTISGDGYVGLAVAADASQGTSTLFVCGRNGTTNGVNGMFFFLTVQINNANGELTVINGTATGIRNLTTDTRIQCVFDIPVVGDPRPRTVDTTSVVQLGSGSVNGSNLGTFIANLTTPLLDLTNPAANVNTTTPPTSSALVTRTGCGMTKLCVETPEDCDPATNNTCLFTAVNGTAGVAPNGATLSFELSGTSSGDAYVGVALTANASEGTGMLYVCGRNGTTNGVNGTFFFLTVQINNTNGALTVMNGTATGIQNLTSDTRIQCVFDISGVNATATRKRDTTFVVQLGSGTVNGSTLGPFNVNVTTPPLNLLDPTSNLNTTATTVAPTTMSGANRALIPQALPLLLSIFILSILKTA